MSHMSNQRLADKSVVIVGGTSGLGLSAALACVAEDACVVVTGREEKKCRQAVGLLGTNSRYIVGDAIEPASTEAAVQLAVDEFGRLDGLYHVAGGSGRSQGDGPLDQITSDGWEYTIRQNMSSLFYSNRAAVRQFLAQESVGSVLNMSSVLADSPSPRFFATHAYAVAKAGVIGLTKASAAYYSVQNIRFNVVAPALVDTPLATRAKQDSQVMKYIASKQPLDGGRIGRPSDVDEAVIFFLSDKSRFVTGQVLAVDGGWSLSEGQHSTL